jgi:cysteine synthase A
MKEKNIANFIGNTPLVKLNNIAQGFKGRILAKLESFNPLASIKDRTALYLINDAEKKGLLNKDSVIVEPTSGNTGIALAYLSLLKGYKVVIVLPETASEERKKIIKALGAKLIETPADKGMQGAIDTAKDILRNDKNSLMLDQFNNAANPQAHYETTGPEIWQATEGKVDFLVAGVGTGGTITGAGSFLKEKNPAIKIIAVEPEESSVLSGNKSGTHKIQGIGAGFVPQVLNRDILDEIIMVSSQKAKESTLELACKEGILTGISSGAALSAALQVAQRDENHNKNIVVVFPDGGERYISGWLFEEV